MDIKDSYLHGTVGVVKSISVAADKLKYKLADIAGTVKEITLPVATTSANGLMSSADKNKLDAFNLGSLKNNLILKINSGTTEGTSLYTYNGSAAKTLDIKNGTGIGFANNAGSLQIYNSGVRSIATGTTNGTISVNTNGTSANVAVKGLGSAAYISKDNLMTYTDYNGDYVAARLATDALKQKAAEKYIEYWASQGWYNSKWGWVEAVNGFKGSLTGNASSATKLQTKRKLWGQDFDGTADVNGTLNIQLSGTNIFGIISHNKNMVSDTYTGFVFGKDASQYNRGNIVYKHVGDKNILNRVSIGLYDSDDILSVVGNGCVGINNTSPTERLQVNGNVKATSFIGNLDWSYITNKPTSFTPAAHDHSRLSGWADTRSVANVPNDYNGIFKVQGIKKGSALGLTSTQVGAYATIIGWRGWTDSSGGYAWEIASTDKNRLYVRSGDTTTWNNEWSAIAYVTDTYPTSQINKLTGYTKAISAADLATTDTLNQALGKLEYKTDTTYRWYQSITEDDTDDIVNKWDEIVDFIDSVKEGTDITDEFVTRKTNQTITGAKSFSTVVNITGASSFAEGIRLHHLGGLSSLWFGAVNNSGYDPGMWGITVNNNGMRFRGTDSTTGTSASDYVNIIHGGNVGIGTTNPSQKLQVNGNILAAKFITSGGTSSQFVKGDGSLDSTSYATTSSLGSYLPLAGGTMNNGAIVKFNASGGLIQTTSTTSNATALIQWYKGTSKDANYSHTAQIGWHNTGNTDGAIYLVPNPQNLDPWGGSVGLYIGKTQFKWNNNVIIHAGNYTQYTPILNSSSTHATNTSKIYAPSVGGTANQVLISNGDAAPTWTNQSNITAGYANKLKYASVIKTQESLDAFLESSIFKIATFSELTSLGFSGNDGMILSIPWSSANFGAQIVIDDNKSGLMKIRQRDKSGWSDWRTFLTSNNYTSYLPFLNSSDTHATNTSVIYTPTTAGTQGQILTSNGSGAPTWINQNTIAAGSAIYLTTQSLNTETDINQTGVRSYYGNGSSWTGAIKSMQYAAILSFGAPNRGWQIWCERGNSSIHYRNGLNDSSGWNTERIILDNVNYASYLGYIGTTAVQTTSTAQALTGITRISNKTSSNLYLGNSDNSGWVLTQNIASHTGTGLWSIRTNGTAAFANTVTSKGFIKTNSTDEYILLGGGSHKAIASFFTGLDADKLDGVDSTGFIRSISYVNKTDTSADGLLTTLKNVVSVGMNGVRSNHWDTIIYNKSLQWGYSLIYNQNPYKESSPINLGGLFIEQSGNLYELSSTGGSSTQDVSIKASRLLTETNYSNYINSTNFPGLAGVRSVTINNDYLRVNTNGIDADLTIPYATKATSLKHTPFTTGQDLNTIKQECVYVSTYTATCASLVNGPTGRSNGEIRLESVNCGSNSYGFQTLYTRDSNNFEIWYRTWHPNSFTSWVKNIHSGNYTDYTVKKDGVGATGTWSISITGNAGSASTSAKLSSTTIISSKEFSLSNASWTDTGYTFASLDTGTYAVQVTFGTTLVASGIMSVYKNLSDTAGDEIPLHVYGTAGWRPYLRTYANKLQISSNDTTNTARTVTIKIAQIL